ncbi:hypothetical protein BDW59DRAFT_24526 [Aspergillus cavernicola]|uniref:Polyketide synthase n=1 Tax=Aspergillus cavernicola TaxID=176166 RepID=A0ABR4HEN9_9EURO
MAAQTPPTTPIAIVGMGCRFSGDATSPEKLWDILAEGKSGWSPIPSSRFNVEGIYHPNSEKVGSTPVRGGHFLTEDVALFDAPFFNIPSEVANSLDPQYRMELEVVYEALESAGIPLEKVMGSNTSVYGGIMFRDYHDTLSRDPDLMPRYFMTGNAATMASNRISHFYDLRGPSMSVDTGCSTTLTALHLACQNLRSQESSMSVVTGASLMLNPDIFISMSSLGFLSPDGMSYAFDSRANGYGRGEGVAAILLKRLDDAVRDGDHIRAIIRETALNQDGKTPTITAPSQEAQAELIRSCYQQAGLDPSHTTYVEAHGTGTPTGDPLEVGAVASTLATKRVAEQPLYIGSVKANIGHTEATSGLASIIKVALALERGLIPPNGNFESLNEKLRLGDRNMKVPTSVEKWPTVNGVRRASVNNFGFGGANAHAILECATPSSSLNGATNGHANGWLTNGQNGHAPANGHINGNGIETPAQDRARIFILSARDEQACERMAENLKDHLLNSPPLDADRSLDELAYTLGSRRSMLPWMAAYPATSWSSLIDALDAGRFKPVRSSEAAPRLGFVFTGQGAQWYAMGRELLDAYPVFKAAISECDRYIKEMGAEWTILEELYRDAKSTNVNDVVYSLPMSSAIQIALIQLLRSWGIKPAAVTSHSSGEIASAYAAGALDVRSAIGITYLRGALAASSRGKEAGKAFGKGGMIAVGLERERANEYLAKLTSGRLVVACVNSQSSVTVSGDIAGIDELEPLLQADNIFARRLKVSEAFHSDHMLPMADLYGSALMGLLKPEPGFGSVIYSSPKLGGRVDRGDIMATPAHWVESMLQPVEFERSFREMCFANPTAKDPRSTQSVDVVIEVGPHGALGGPIQDLMTLPEFQGAEIPYLTCLIRGKNAVETMHQLAVDLIKKGYRVDLDAVNFPHGRHGIKVLSNLPAYPWNHQTRYWVESRLNKANRQRQRPPHDLLGSLLVGANASTPTWRHIIRAADVPWVRDHMVQSNMVYPGAGFITMAIEGMAQLSESNAQRITSYTLRNVDLLAALMIPEHDEGVEVQLLLRPCDEQALGSKDWYEFQVHSVTADNAWTEHCKGQIQVERETAAFPLSSVTHRPQEAVYTRNIDPRDIWASMRSVGIYHGPIFQNLLSVELSKRGSRSTLEIADTAIVMPMKYQRPHIVHPTTLDSVIQAAYSTIPSAGTKLTSAFVPRSIKTLRVSTGTATSPGHKFRAYAGLEHQDTQTFRTGISVFDELEGSTPVIEIDGLVCQSLGGAMRRPDEPELCSSWKWEPDLTLLNLESLKESMKIAPLQPEIDTMMELRRGTILYIHEAVSALTPADLHQLEWHHVKLYDWMTEQLRLAREDKLGPDSSTWLGISPEEKSVLLEKMGTASVNGEMIQRLGPQLLAMLRQEIAPLELMLEDQLLMRYYAEAPKWGRSNQQAADMVRLCTHKNPRAKILEIGGGTGGCTQVVLDTIGDSFGRYDFTDVSSGFFTAAQERFSKWQELMTFKKLDIESNPEAQGFECGTYDVVVACQVLHATKNMVHTLSNVRRLLKPGGRLILVETTRDDVDVFLTFGLLPGWWLSEEPERKSSPSLTIPFWNEVLTCSGLSGVDLEVHDCESDDFYSLSAMMSTVPQELAEYPSEVAIVCGISPPPPEWLSELQAAIAGITGSVPVVEQMDSLAAAAGKTCIFLAELEQPILATVNTADFKAITSIVSHCKGLLWLSCGGTIESPSPEASMHLGLLRTLRSEYGGNRYVSLDVDPNREALTSTLINAIVSVFKAAFGNQEPTIADSEYAEREGTVFVPRAFKDEQLNNAITEDSANPTAALLQPFCDAERPVRLEIGTPGLLDTLTFTDEPDAMTALPSDFIEIDPKAFGLNFRDIMVAMGQLEKNKIMGFECSGTITRLGEEAAAQGFQVGDRVCSLLRGYWSTRPRVHWTSAITMPEHLTFEEAAAFPLAFATAYVSLYETARLQKEEKVLIHAATGGVGQAAVILAKHVGAEIYVTVGTQAKRDFMMETYGIPPDHIFSSRDTSFAGQILETTGGKGVDVVLNSLSGRILQESFNCLCEFGRFVEIGKRDLEQNSRMDMLPFSRNVSFSAIDMLSWETRRFADVARVMGEIGKLFKQQAIASISPITTYPISAIEKAFRVMQAGQHMGKIVITVHPEDQVRVVQSTPSWSLRPDVSYLIVGGFGGIGRSLCEWMVDHGAKHVVIMSRSATSGPFLTELQAACNVRAVACDVSDAGQLAVALESFSDMPPIKGVIQAAMVLKDAMVEQMALEDFYTAVRPKVHGSWNLHHQLPELDFFVMLSSLIGVMGGAGQANYAAGGAFQDALASYRRAQGQPAVTIDLGMVKGVGYVANTKGVSDRLARIGYQPIDEEGVLRILQSVISSPSSAQVTTGINTGPGSHWKDADWLQDVRFAGLKFRESTAKKRSGPTKNAGDLRGQLSNVSSPGEAAELILKAITNKLISMFAFAEADVAPSKNLAEFGVDSLIAVELRNWITSQTGLGISIFELMQSPSLTELANMVASKRSEADML